MASPSGCQDFCIADYLGVNCTAFTVAPSSQLYSTCTLYQTWSQSQVSSGSMDLWTITCHPAPGKRIATKMMCTNFRCSELRVWFLECLGFVLGDLRCWNRDPNATDYHPRRPGRRGVRSGADDQHSDVQHAGLFCRLPVLGLVLLDYVQHHLQRRRNSIGHQNYLGPADGWRSGLRFQHSQRVPSNPVSSFLCHCSSNDHDSRAILPSLVQ
jgi:hypothetical protein